jgi:tRNA-2-methylthio-N6-dimethylallyladenosine synthase
VPEAGEDRAARPAQRADHGAPPARDFAAAVVGRVLPVLIEKPGRKPGQLGGRSPYLQAVHMEPRAPERLIGTIQPVEIVGVGFNSLSGRIVTVRN